MAKRGKRNKKPKRWKLSRPARMGRAKAWIPTYEGNDIVKGYMKWYKVERHTAMIELQMLGEKITDKQIAEAKKEHQKKVNAATIRNRQKKAQKKCEEFEMMYPDSNENFAFIAGYTSNGVPFGTTWEEIGEEPPEFF